MAQDPKLKQRVKTARGRKIGSTRWLQRQLNDPLVKQAKADGYRSRAAYKIIEIQEKHKIFSKGKKVLDLGAAPGGWTQIALKHGCSVLAVDLLDIDPIPGAVIIKGDFLETKIDEEFDIILSDMAPNTIGDKGTDHIRLMTLVEEAYWLALEKLSKGGALVVKIFQGGEERKLWEEMRKQFETVKYFKPSASRSDSKEIYLVALNKK